jgi:protein TonB
MLEFVYGNIRYPKPARRQGVEGICVVSFVVEKDGRLTNIRLRRDIGAGCGEEVLRVVQLMNEQDIRWIPGKQDGEVVRVEFNLPVQFRLE